jgi:copper resistance protein C
MERLPIGRVARAGLLAIVTLALVAPLAVMAHAELDTATPADGATVDGSPPEVSGTFTQDMKVDGSSLELRDADGQIIAKGGVDPSDPRRMAIEDLPVLAPGAYEVRWTTISAEDDETARDHWSFTVAATASPSPTVAPSTAATPATTASATAATTATATPPSAAPSASVAPPTVAPTVAPSPTASGDTGEPAASTSDILLPILAGLAIVVVVAVVLLRRRGRSTPPA